MISAAAALMAVVPAMMSQAWMERRRTPSGAARARLPKSATRTMNVRIHPFSSSRRDSQKGRPKRATSKPSAVTVAAAPSAPLTEISSTRPPARSNSRIVTPSGIRPALFYVVGAAARAMRRRTFSQEPVIRKLSSMFATIRAKRTCGTAKERRSGSI